MVIPLFLLDLVLFPHAVVPLHVFEERYKEMIGRCLSDGVEFGIARAVDGAVIGGRAHTDSIGTSARITDHRLLPDGRFVLMGEGTRRFRILGRHDERYPQAEVEFLAPDRGDWLEGDPIDRVRCLERLLRRYTALSSEAEESDEYSEAGLDADLEAATFQAAGLLHVDLDLRQSLLEMGTIGRLGWIESFVSDENVRLERKILER